MLDFSSFSLRELQKATTSAFGTLMSPIKLWRALVGSFECLKVDYIEIHIKMRSWLLENEYKLYTLQDGPFEAGPRAGQVVLESKT